MREKFALYSSLLLMMVLTFIGTTPVRGEHNSPDYPVCKILCVENVELGEYGLPVYYNINRNLTEAEHSETSSSIVADIEGKSLTINVMSPVNGTLNIALQWILQAEQNNARSDYAILIDGDVAEFRELSREAIYNEFERLEQVARSVYLDEARLLSIKFPAGSHVIKIVGTGITYYEEHPGEVDFFPYHQYECQLRCDYDLRIDDKFYPIGYGLVGDLSGKPDSVRLISIVADIERKAIVANIETTSFGTFHAFLPRYVIQSTNDTAETDFTVLVDGKRADFDEYKGEPMEPFRYRMLTIDFDKGAKKIEIIGTWISDGQDFSDPDPYFPCGSLEQNCTYILQAAGNNKTMPLRYAISGDEKTGDKEFPRIEKVYVYTISDSLYFYVESPHQDGHLTLELSPEIADQKSDSIVYGGGSNTPMNHTNVVRKDARLLNIQFGKGSHEIEVSGISLFEKGEKVVPPPEFPCAINDCVYSNLAGASGSLYDVRYHISGWRNFGYPDNVRVDGMSIDRAKNSLVVNITAEQSGRMDIILEEGLMTNELAGSKGINYVVYIHGKQVDTSWPGPDYYPDRKERVAAFDFPRGATQVKIIGVPVERCGEHIYSKLEFCLYEVNLNGTLYPLLIKYSPDHQDANASLSINGVSVDEEKKSVIFNLTATHGGFVHFIPTKEMIGTESHLSTSVNGKIDSGADNIEGQVNVWFFVPAGSSRVELIGTSVAPEFGSATAIAMAATLAGIVVAAKHFRLKGAK